MSSQAMKRYRGTLMHITTWNPHAHNYVKEAQGKWKLYDSYSMTVWKRRHCGDNKKTRGRQGFGGKGMTRQSAGFLAQQKYCSMQWWWTHVIKHLSRPQNAQYQE